MLSRKEILHWYSFDSLIIDPLLLYTPFSFVLFSFVAPNGRMRSPGCMTERVERPEVEV